ncbi:MAG: hypothetical protein IJC99_06225 [Clostridia bacterium]|nr:hypothetical protein [Clostridia bacterium]
MSEETRDLPIDGLPEEEFAGLLEGIGKIAPLLGKLTGTGALSPAARGREGVLLALKPYLSPTRCEAVDYLVRMARISDALRTLGEGSHEATPERRV